MTEIERLKIKCNQYAKRLVNLGEDDVVWEGSNDAPKKTAPNSEYVVTPKLPSLSDVQQAVLGYVYSEEEVSLVYDTIKKLGNFTYSRNVMNNNLGGYYVKN